MVASALALPFRQGVFDSCTMLEVIEHMSPQRQEVALREARRVVRKGGQFIISTPNLMYGLFNIVWWAWEKTAGRQWLHEHVGMLDTQRLVRILRKSGFDVVSNKRIAVFDRIIETKCSK